MNIEWKREQNTYSFTTKGYIGKFKAFEISYDGMSSRNETKKEKLTTSLNGIKTSLGNFISEDEAKSKAQDVLDYWLQESGLVFKGDQNEN